MGQPSSDLLLTADQQIHLKEVITSFRGNGEVLQNALGALLIGQVYGWRVLRVMYSGASYARYQKVLQLKFNEWCPDETPLSERHKLYKAYKLTGKFWEYIKGKISLPKNQQEDNKEFS